MKHFFFKLIRDAKIKHRKAVHLFFTVFPALLLLTGCSHSSTSGTGSGSASDSKSGLTGSSSAVTADTQIRDTDFCLDTVITITLNGTDDPSLLDSCFDLIREYESLLSRTIEGSDVWNINHSNGQPTEVSEETAELIRMALEFSELTNGAFDITVAPVTALWDFTGEEPHEIPQQSELEEALSHVDYRTVILEETSQANSSAAAQNPVSQVTVTLTDPDASIDLGGIAKGWIADRLKEYLEGQGITSGMIDLGGNILTIGTKPSGKSWNIGIRRPFGDTSDAIAVVPVTDQTVVTSGTYERYFEENGTIYHHLLDPSTGYPADNGLASVTILTDSSARADALSTGCFVLGPESGMELIESLDGVEALFITNNSDLFRSSGFPE